MEQRLKACSHYCERQKGKPYFPYSECQTPPGPIRLTRKKVLIRFYLGSFIYWKLKHIRNLIVKSLPLGIFHKRHYSNNRLCIDITTACNLRCFNCQSSVRQAPASNIMSVEQIEKFINEAIELKYYWDRISLFGGEPTLHPKIFQILRVFEKYKDFNPECEIYVVTNGAGDKVKSVLAQLPNWVSLENDNKEEGRNAYPFSTYNIAPIDTLAYRFFSDFSKGCTRRSGCYGLGLSMYGYYPCSPCMHVDRVFGFDIGIKKLSLVTEKALRGQMKILCQYCGWFKEPDYELVSTEKISRSWNRVYAEYKKHKPKLSLYGIIIIAILAKQNELGWPLFI